MISADARILLQTRGLRAFGDGYVSLLLPAYLLELGRSPLEVGILATVTLVGSGIMTLGVGLHAYRFHYRAVLLAAAALMAATGLGFAFITDFWPLLVIALVGTLNPSSGDVSVFLPLEHAVISRVVKNPAAPEWEQILSAGAACQNLIVAATALGYGAQWITEWYGYSPGIRRALALADNERVAGFVYIGTPKEKPEDRERPKLADIVAPWRP